MYFVRRFVLYVNGEKVVTDIKVNDGYWHFLCVTWESEYGSWAVFVDGIPKDSGVRLARGTVVQGTVGAHIISKKVTATLYKDTSELENCPVQLMDPSLSGKNRIAQGVVSPSRRLSWGSSLCWICGMPFCTRTM